MRQVYPERVRIGEEQKKKVLEGYSIERWQRSWGKAVDSVGRGRV
jgi:DNA-directed RNA polymerase subunit H (RpoH/RPB5)